MPEKLPYINYSLLLYKYVNKLYPKLLIYSGPKNYFKITTTFVSSAQIFYRLTISLPEWKFTSNVVKFSNDLYANEN